MQKAAYICCRRKLLADLRRHEPLKYNLEQPRLLQFGETALGYFGSDKSGFSKASLKTQYGLHFAQAAVGVGPKRPDPLRTNHLELGPKWHSCRRNLYVWRGASWHFRFWWIVYSRARQGATKMVAGNGPLQRKTAGCTVLSHNGPGPVTFDRARWTQHEGGRWRVWVLCWVGGRAQFRNFELDQPQDKWYLPAAQSWAFDCPR